MSLTCVPLVKKWMRQNWTKLQNSQYPEQDLMEACFQAVNAENTQGWYKNSGYL